MKKILASTAIVVSTVVMAFATMGGVASADPQCAPGQQGNPHPAFKPGVCGNDRQAGWSWNGDHPNPINTY